MFPAIAGFTYRRYEVLLVVRLDRLAEVAPESNGACDTSYHYRAPDPPAPAFLADRDHQGSEDERPQDSQDE